MGKHGAQLGEKNPFWKGGRSIASNGYVLVRVGADHHLADVRGYAYEHRIVAEQALGRRLKPGELVHHRDGDKKNNHPDNLEVVAGNAEHFVHHRRADRGLRMPGQSNEVIACACGCGRKFYRFDASGRPRTYISGHNPSIAPTQQTLLALLRRGPTPLQDLIAQSGRSSQSVKTCLSKMRKLGWVQPVAHGVWALVERC